MGTTSASTTNFEFTMGSLVMTKEFAHILRISNTNVDGRRKIAHALTAIKGIGLRYATLCLKKADIDVSKRAGELSPEEIERIMTVVTHPRQFKIPICSSTAARTLPLARTRTRSRTRSMCTCATTSAPEEDPLAPRSPTLGASRCAVSTPRAL